jgi:hypothetical protein
MSLTRKEFLTSVVGAVAGVAGAAVLVACGGDGESSDAGVAKNCATNGALAAIGANHGHMMMVTAAEVNAGLDKTYSIQGSAGHTHMVTVTAAQFNTMKTNAGTNITINSSQPDMGMAHMHAIMISCA